MITSLLITHYTCLQLQWLTMTQVHYSNVSIVVLLPFDLCSPLCMCLQQPPLHSGAAALELLPK